MFSTTTSIDTSTLIIRSMAIVVNLGAIWFLLSTQRRIDCEVHGTCPRVEHYGVPQVIDARYKVETQNLLAEMEDYFREYREDPNTSIRMHDILDNCKTKNENCAFWSLVGECKKAQGFMSLNCAPVCKTCELLSMERRCPLDPSIPKVWGPGGLNETFHHITTLPANVKKYDQHVLSRPYHLGDAGKSDSKTLDYKIGPWFLYIDDFLSGAECDHLIELGHELGFQPALDIGAPKYDGTYEEKQNPGRTSKSSWCIEKCDSDEMVEGIMERISLLVGIPSLNAEFPQILKYEKGQQHSMHNDYFPSQRDRQPGVRIMTVFLYLSSSSTGMTRFPSLNISVRPQKGRILIFPNVLDEDPDAMNGLMQHEAEPLLEGVKYACNIWFHQRDFKTSSRIGCH